MANAFGIRFELNHDNLGDSYKRSEAYKDVSGLGIVMPFTVSVRARLYADVVAGTGTFMVACQAGGSSQYHGAVMLVTSDDLWNDLSTFCNENGNDSNSQTLEANAITDPTTNWFWIQLDLRKNGANPELTVKFKETDSTSIPSTWDTTVTESTVVNILDSDTIDEVRVKSEIYDSIGSLKQIIAEIDEIHVVQET